MLNNFIAILNQIVIIIGVPAIIAGLIYIGKKLQILEDLKEESKSIESFSKCATGAIIEMQTHLAGKGFLINQKLAYTAGSPLKLTEFGETMMQESGFAKIISDEEKRKILIDMVKGKNPQNNYDIQEFSMKTMAELAEKNNPVAVPLKEYAYEKGLPLELILNSAGIVLRDEVMKEIKFSDKI